MAGCVLMSGLATATTGAGEGTTGARLAARSTSGAASAGSKQPSLLQFHETKERQERGTAGQENKSQGWRKATEYAQAPSSLGKTIAQAFTELAWFSRRTQRRHNIGEVRRKAGHLPVQPMTVTQRGKWETKVAATNEMRSPKATGTPNTPRDLARSKRSPISLFSPGSFPTAQQKISLASPKGNLDPAAKIPILKFTSQPSSPSPYFTSSPFHHISLSLLTLLRPFLHPPRIDDLRPNEHRPPVRPEVFHCRL
ncbi:uncharacterized protein SPSK_05509 [Sporothrix schenckii 1099-18]|uniref:Uncharacterized protein n=1 Tax=Sporothrix schenckii 1099-18 TaxID=1397361 RepID=A0A0F2LV75_SPOSC|nr:uncharacterized protein SPSK_05509 [Sporothrix schenckii 1099-18]KJR80400.1 hypothetical protein SPSK_05509 [Sporothrix schenckii 1099-18]